MHLSHLRGCGIAPRIEVQTCLLDKKDKKKI